MRRLLTAIVALSLALLQAQAGAFHTHAVGADQDNDHRHGPAIHHHDDGGSEQAPHVDEADFSSDVITAAIPVGINVTGALLYTESAEVLVHHAMHCVGRAPTIVTRSHDPPRRFHALLRGPPPSLSA